MSAIFSRYDFGEKLLSTKSHTIADLIRQQVLGTPHIATPVVTNPVGKHAQ